MIKRKRKTYDTRIKYLVRHNLLPDVYRKQIPKSCLSKWGREANDKYTGHELNGNLEELYELMKKISADERMIKVLKSFYRINKTLKDIISKENNYIEQVRPHKYKIIETIDRVKKQISLNRAIKLFGLTKHTYRVWALETYHQCGSSISKLCSNSYPQQLTVKEINKMHALLLNKNMLHWPIISVAYYGINKNVLRVHPNTWYKYARLLKIKRRRNKKKEKKYAVGIRATKPNEKWHADITEIKTVDGRTSYIYLVIDNFSRCIISWRVANKICAKIRLETFIEAIQKAGIKPNVRAKKTTELIVDGGTENNNKKVSSFIKQYPVKKLIALKDIIKSNAMIESVNKIIKYDYLFKYSIYDEKQLIQLMEHKIIPDYNNKRPHGSLLGLTPFEAYSKIKVDVYEFRKKMIEGCVNRVNYNRKNVCANCAFACKQ